MTPTSTAGKLTATRAPDWRRRLLAAAIAALALLGTLALLIPTAAAANPTRAQYAAQVEPICQANTDENGRILKGVRKLIKRDRLTKAGKRFLRAKRAFAAAVDQIAVVPQPSADLAVLSSWIEYLRTEATLIGKLGKALRKGKRAKAQAAFIRLKQNGNAANDTVVGFGFDHCLIRASRFT